MTEIRLLVAVIAVLCCCSTIGHCQVTSYVLKATQDTVEEEGGFFDTTLTCQTKLGFEAPNALFYRNGGDVNTDPCLNSTVYMVESAVGRIKLKITSECDGYYSCGVQQSSDDYVLSKPKSIYSKSDVYNYTLFNFSFQQNRLKLEPAKKHFLQKKVKLYTYLARFPKVQLEHTRQCGTIMAHRRFKSEL